MFRRVSRRQIVRLSGVTALAALATACGAAAPTATAPPAKPAAPEPSLAATPPGALTKPAAAAPAATSAPAAAAPTPTTAAAPAAAAKPTEAAKPAAAAPASKDAITLTYWAPTDNTNYLKGYVDDWHAKNPTIKIEHQKLPFTEHYTKYQTVAAAGQAPDVAFISSNWILDFAKLGVLMNLDPLIKKHNLFGPSDQGKYFLNVLDAARYPTSKNGSIYGVPYNYQVILFYYNKQLFDAAKEPHPDGTWTYAKVAEVAQRLTKRSGNQVEQYGFVPHWGYATLDSSIHANGGNFVSEDYKKAVFDSPENIETVQWWVDLIHKDKSAPVPTEFTQGGPANFFNTGRAAMFILGGWNMVPLREQTKFDWGISYLPKGKNHNNSVTWPDQHSIAAKSKYPDQAFDFSLFAIRPERPLDTYPPAAPPFLRQAALSEAWLEKDKKPGNKEIVLDIGAKAIPLQIGFRWTEWRNKLVNDELQLAFLGEKKVADAVKAAHKGIQDVLDRP